jgi:hypothetical protein
MITFPTFPPRHHLHAVPQAAADSSPVGPNSMTAHQRSWLLLAGCIAMRSST